LRRSARALAPEPSRADGRIEGEEEPAPVAFAVGCGELVKQSLTFASLSHARDRTR
jgi:hypothetical protein